MSSDDSEQSSKTEDPSAKRVEDARLRGDVAKSPEVVTWLMLGGTGGSAGADGAVRTGAQPLAATARS